MIVIQDVNIRYEKDVRPGMIIYTGVAFGSPFYFGAIFHNKQLVSVTSMQWESDKKLDVIASVLKNDGYDLNSILPLLISRILRGKTVNS